MRGGCGDGAAPVCNPAPRPWLDQSLLLELLLELELDEPLELEFEEPFELELDELLELEFEELLEELFDELLDDRFELELPELLELRLLELFMLELDERRVLPSALLPRRSPVRPTLRAAVFRPRSQALKKPCTGVRARPSPGFRLVSSACAVVAVRAPTTAAVIRALCFVFMVILSNMGQWTTERLPPVGAAFRRFTGFDADRLQPVCTDNARQSKIFRGGL